ncbi:cellular communication network factor 1, like 2 isoform X4 [Stegastes partitus]|uniref:Protein CYR61-like n=1 Tax=Stegastes partitus TaxID=144197 RepID=A0A3B4YXM0_9TELE|nr:PREDICTED: protein CYR61-like isoform X3 [Stegastes partitus]XP_008275234.1 PREDICTED: protein CYR61-like isoform X4 [Stegastes partitus]
MLSPVTLQQIISTLVVLGSVEVIAEGECPAECSCAPLPPLCLPGVSWVTDHCGCCKVCARQFNEGCSATEPCDHIKGLHCHLGVRGDPERGLCRAEAHGLPCAFNGRVYQHGEDFQPICQYQCTCMNGVVGCMPLCPNQVPLPNWRCSLPRLALPEGGCCEVWVCDDDNHISEEAEEPTHTSLPDSQPHPNHISALLKAQPQPRHPAAIRGPTFREMVSFPMFEVFIEPRCFPQTTEWSQCSAACGIGISSRVTNNNPDCQLVTETRLCLIRHCELQLPVTSKGKKCQRTIRPQEPVSITFAGCSTAQRYRPRTCGTCTDGRCCSPSLSRTVRLRFHCPDRDTFYNIMWIQRCSCSTSFCIDSGSSSPSINLYNDIHTFRD